MHKAYYNENNPYAAQWLRNLMEAGLIAPGYVDERSIELVKPSDLIGYTQVHLFAGLGLWSLALRRAGWDDSRPVWTISCPCQPFSIAGEGAGFADERHLWPAANHLVSEFKPSEIFGEQVASKAVDEWIDLVHADLEALDYAFGCLPFPAASIGAPHIRDRAYWVGLRSLANANIDRPQGSAIEMLCGAGGRKEGDAPGCGGTPLASEFGNPSATNGYWRNADWLQCRDGNWRAVEPGSFPLAPRHWGGMGRVRADQESIAEVPARKDQGSRQGRLKGYGNAINVQQAQVWIETVMELL